VSDDETLCRLDPGPFAGLLPDLGVFCSRGCLERPCVHTWPLLAAINGWEPLDTLVRPRCPAG
jgi:hypothetical protein